LVNELLVAKLAHESTAFAALANVLLMADTLGYNEIVVCLTIEIIIEIPS
jgi:hypothetical protein